jgi:tetratricopeptide (TPR) repeat protein
MKYPIYIFLLITQVFWAQGGFEKGNELYRKEKYAEAVTAYESVLATKKHSADLYFNLGNAYYKQNKVAPAIYNFEKALLLKPNDADIKNNMKFAHKMMIDEVKEVPQVGFRKIIADFTSAFSYNAWGWISIVFSVLFLIFFAGYYFSGIAMYKRVFFIGMIVWMFAIIVSVLAATFEKTRAASERPAIVFAGIASVKSEPKSSAGDVFTVHEGTKVYVLETLDEWKRVSLPDGTDGWIDQNAIKELK